MADRGGWTDRYLGDGKPLTPDDASALIIKMVEQTGAMRLPDEHRRYILDVCVALVNERRKADG